MGEIMSDEEWSLTNDATHAGMKHATGDRVGPRRSGRERTPTKRPEVEGFGDSVDGGGSGSAMCPCCLDSGLDLSGGSAAGGKDEDEDHQEDSDSDVKEVTSDAGKKKRATQSDGTKIADNTRTLARPGEKDLFFRAIQKQVPAAFPPKEAAKKWADIMDILFTPQDVQITKNGKTTTIRVDYLKGRPEHDRNTFPDQLKKLFGKWKTEHKLEESKAPKKTGEGTLTAEELTGLEDDSEIRAKAYRPQDRLASEIDATATTLPIILADSLDDEAIKRMVSQTKVVITTVGPYRQYGAKLVAACAAAGVHCCDLTGESLWLKEVIEKHHEEAERTGAKIVPSCGIDSIPADLGTLMMVDHMKRTRDVRPDDVRYYMVDFTGGFSGGTYATFLDVYEQASAGGEEVVKKLGDPLLLTKEPGLFGKAGSPGGLGYDSVAKSWTSACVFAPHDAKIVYRSAGLLGYPATFSYKEVVGHKSFSGAFLSNFALSLQGFFMSIPVTRALIAKMFVPAPGEGPSKKERDSGRFWVNFLARGRSEDGKEVVCRGKVGSDKGDASYKETAKMLAECGLCLALDDLESKAGGVLTAASAMGMPLIDRLNRAGMTFKIVDE